MVNVMSLERLSSGFSLSLTETHDCLNQLIGPHALLDIGHGGLDFRYAGLNVGKVSMGDLCYGNDVIFKTLDAFNLNNYCITRPKNGNIIFNNPQYSFSADHQQAAIVSPFEKFEVGVEKNCVQSFVSIPKTFVENVLMDLIGAPIQEPLYFHHNMDTKNKKINAWWSFIDYLRSSSTENGFIQVFTDSHNDFQYTLIKALLLSQPHNYSDRLEKVNLKIPEYLKRAIIYIEQNIDRNISIEDLEYASGINRKTLNKSFKKELNMSALSYIKFYRLKKIHDELTDLRDHQKVTDVAVKWGITHLGRMATEYRNLFGETPSETVKRSIIT